MNITTGKLFGRTENKYIPSFRFFWSINKSSDRFFSKIYFLLSLQVGRVDMLQKRGLSVGNRGRGERLPQSQQMMEMKAEGLLLEMVAFFRKLYPFSRMKL